MKWERKTINEVCNVGDGAHASIKRVTNGFQYLTSKNFKLDGLDLSKVDYISEEDYQKHFKDESKAITKPKSNDVLLSIIGSLGAPYLVNEDDVFGLSSSVSILRPKDEIIEPKFLYYWIKSNEFQSSINNIKSGVAQSFLSLGMIKSLPVIYPTELPTQRKIASILSAYDDLIENNLKRIKLLEEKAQLHYQELMQDSSKWDKVRLEEFVSVVKGRKPANVLEQPEEESQLYLLLETVERGKTLYTTDLSLPQSKITDVLMCMDGARSGLSFRGMVGAIGSTMAIWRSNSDRVSGEFLYQFMKHNESAITQGNTGAAIPHANRKFILDMKMAMPPKKEAEYFGNLTLPMIKLINTLHNQNTKLREARDILLPKLMSGQIEA